MGYFAGILIAIYFKDTLDFFPNPASQFMNIAVGDNENIEKVELSDLNGSLLKSFQVNSYAMKLNMQEIRNGIYLIKILTDKNIYIKKIMVKH